MATSINQFLQQATSNTIRSNNQYEVVATSGIAEIDNVLKNAVMFGKNMTLPTRNIEYASLHYKGFECANMVPTHMTMGNEVTININCDTNGEYRRAFLAWQNSVMNADIEGGSVFEGDRGVNEKSIIRVHLLDKDNQTVCETYKFYNVRIKSVGEVSLSYEGGSAAEFSVTCGFTYWNIENAKNGALTSQH
jgi:hypothetical protein